MSIRRSVEGVQEPGERRQLKHRANGDSRTIPAHPELAALLRSHLKEFGTAPDGRPFTGVHGRELATITYRRALISARKAALTPEEQKSPLARRPYDLQHACLSTWLNGGVPATQVAEWAGHSVDVLLRIYAKCIVGQHEITKRRISEALRDTGAQADNALETAEDTGDDDGNG